MSSRALRRLERARNSASPEPESESEEEISYKPKVNAFALLGGDSDSEVEEELEEEDLAAKHQEAGSNAQNDQNATLKEQGKKQNKKSKDSKRKKGKGKKETARSELPEEDDEDLDKFLEKYRQKDRETSAALESSPEAPDAEDAYNLEDPPIWYDDSNYMFFTAARLRKSLPLLSIGNAKNLDPDTELKNLFGNLSLETIEDANTTTSLATTPEVLAQLKKLARLTRGWGGKDHRSVPGTARKLLLTRIKEDWLPTAQKPLTMEEMTHKDVAECFLYKKGDEDYDDIEAKIANEEKLGVRYFRFRKIASVSERVACSRFYASVVMTPDPESLMQLLQQHPYHAETLLQVAMVMLRQGNNKATSNALVEKCLFVFDRSFSKRFHEMLLEAKTGYIRLPYESFMNRQFYLCLFRVISGLAERSTFYTALTYCKLMLSLSPAEDPLGVRYFIDHYAILSDEHQYLMDFVNSPLGNTYGKWYTPGIAYSEVLALLYLDRKDDARAALKRAYAAHPYCGTKLYETIGLGSAPGSVSASNAFVELAAETYLVRAPQLWKEQTHRQFLHDEMQSMLSANQSTVKSWFGSFFNKTAKQQEIPVNLVRFAILSGENKVLAKVPESVFEQDNVLEYDVLPPAEGSSMYDVHSGVAESKATDSLFDYLDHNMIGAIVQNRTEETIDDVLMQIAQAEQVQGQE